MHLVAAASQVAGCRQVLPWPKVCPPTQAMWGLGVWVLSAGCLPLPLGGPLAGPASGPPWWPFLLRLFLPAQALPFEGQALPNPLWPLPAYL